MTIQPILYAIYNVNKMEAIYSKNPNRLMSSGPRNDNDYCQQQAYFGAIEHLVSLAQGEFIYDDEDGFELYSALVEYAAIKKIVEYNPERMIKNPKKDTKFASDLMKRLHEAESRLEKASNRYTCDNATWVKNEDAKIEKNRPKTL